MKTRRRIPIVLAMLAMTLFAAWRAKAGQSAQTPNVVNVKMETHAVSGTLAATLHGIEGQADKPEWVGYSVPQIAGDRTVCCGNFNDGYGGCGTCRLEKENDITSTGSGNAAKNGTVELEGSRQLVVLFRLEGKQVTKIREASEDCTLDAGSLRFLWLTGVKPAESVALLTEFVHQATFEGHGEHEVGQGALTAIALHADASADRAFESFVAADQPEQLRKHASFWLGAITGAIENDPDTEVKKKAVFALSQMPKDEGVPKLIEVAKTNRNPEVRKQAMFWLGQSNDPRALEFFEQVLSR